MRFDDTNPAKEKVDFEKVINFNLMKENKIQLSLIFF